MVIHRSRSRYLRWDDGPLSPSPHRKWMICGMKAPAHSEQALLIAATPDWRSRAGKDDNEVNEEPPAGALGSLLLAEPTSAQSPDATRA